MPTVLDPFQFVLIAVAGWMNQRQLQMIEYLREENRVLREQLGERRLRVTEYQRRRFARVTELGRQVLAEGRLTSNQARECGQGRCWSCPHDSSSRSSTACPFP